MLLSQPGVEGFSFVLLELLNKSVLHLGQERRIELIPLGRPQIRLFQLSHFSENVYVASNMQIPALYF